MLQTPGPFIPVDVEYRHERILAEFPRMERQISRRRGRGARSSSSGRLRRLLGGRT